MADASAVVAVLGPATALGEWSAAAMTGRVLVAPALMPFEVGGALRRLEIRQVLDPASATAALRELLAMAVELWPGDRLAARAWALRASVAYADACYVALAELLDAPLVTIDRRLARAPGPACVVVAPPEGL